MPIRAQNMLAPRKRRHQRQQTRLRQMKIREQLIYDAESLARVKKNSSLPFFPRRQSPRARAFFSAASSSARTTVVPIASTGRFARRACSIACAVASGISYVSA